MSDLEPPSSSTASTWRERVDLLTSTGVQPSARQAVVAGALVVALGIAGWALLLRPPAGPPVEELLPVAPASSGAVGASSASTATTSGEVVAHAAGAVVSPGVYRLPPGARVADLLDAAGGPAPDADVDRLNLAAIVTDGERVYVPRVGEAVVLAASASGADTPDGPLDLNAATAEQLEELPGIGPATAAAIVSAREERGGFRSVDDLLDVRGIGPAKLEAIRDLVRV